MNKVVISVENLSKSYRLGQIGTGTFAHDLSVWWARVRGKPNPMLKIGEEETGDGRRGTGDERETERPTSVLRPQSSVLRPPSSVLWALKDVSFTVEQGEVLGIIGRNGAGKSTLLKILSRVTAPTSGRIRVKGRVASLLEVGTGFHPELTGRENVYLNGAILGMTKQEVARKFDEIVDFAGVEKFIDTPVKRYSSGMYVRLAFAVAAHLEPEILVVDEVLAVGDAEFQKKCLGKMGEVAHEGRTVLFVSHNMGAIQALCQNAIVLSSGTLFCQSEVGIAVRHYLSLTDSLKEVKLIERKDRAGNGRVRINDAYFMDINGNKKYRVSPQDKITLVFGIENPKETLDRVVFMVTMYDQSGYALAFFSNELTGDNIELDTGHNEIQCTLSGLPLRPGIYSINIALRKDADFFDHVQNALKIELIDDNFFQAGKLMHASSAPILIDQSWHQKNMHN